MGAPALGNRLSFFSGRAGARALTAAAASGKGAGFHNGSFLPQPGCPAGQARSLKNPKIGCFEAGGFAGDASHHFPRREEHRAAPALNLLSRGGGRPPAFPFSLTPPEKTPDLSPPHPRGLAVAKRQLPPPGVAPWHAADFHFIYLLLNASILRY